MENSSNNSVTDLQLKVQNRVLSPSLILYRIELTSFFSIFQRVTGVLLSLFLLFFVSFCHVSNYFLSLSDLYINYFYVSFSMSNVLFYTIYVFIFLMFLFHFFNGFRIFLQDRSFFWSKVLLKLEIFYVSCYFIVAAVFIYFFMFWFRIFGLGFF